MCGERVSVNPSRSRRTWAKWRQSKGEGRERMERKAIIDSVMDRLLFVVFRWKPEILNFYFFLNCDSEYL